MQATIIDGVRIAREVRAEWKQRADRLAASGILPGLAVIMVGDASVQADRGRKMASPKSVGGVNTQSLMFYVDDAEAHCAQARAAGAKIVSEPKTTDYGEEYWTDRGYECEDLEGHRWWFYQRLRDPKSK